MNAEPMSAAKLPEVLDTTKDMRLDRKQKNRLPARRPDMAKLSEKVATEIARAIIQAGLEDLEMSFDDLCEEAGIDPSEVEDLRHD